MLNVATPISYNKYSKSTSFAFKELGRLSDKREFFLSRVGWEGSTVARLPPWVIPVVTFLTPLA